MLVNKRKGALALAAAVSMLAGVAQAESHVIMIVDGGYFPAVIYAQPGDNLIFENWSEAEHTVGDPNGSWTSASIPSEGGNFVLHLTEETPLIYAGLDVYGDTITGEISHDAPPYTE